MKGFKVVNNVYDLSLKDMDKGYIYLSLHGLGDYRELIAKSKHSKTTAFLLHIYEDEILLAEDADRIIKKDPDVKMRFRPKSGKVIVDYESVMNITSTIAHRKDANGIVSSGVKLTTRESGDVVLQCGVYSVLLFCLSGRVRSCKGVRELNGKYSQERQMIVK